MSEERKHEDVCVPEVVTFVGRTAQSLGWNTGTDDPGRGLVKLEDDPIEGLLQTVLASDPNCCPFPELRQVLLLLSSQTDEVGRGRERSTSLIGGAAGKVGDALFHRGTGGFEADDLAVGVDQPRPPGA